MNNVVIATHEYPPRIGGAGVVARDLATSLSKRKDCNVTVVTHYAASLSETLSRRLLYDYSCDYTIVRLPVFKGTWFFSYPYTLHKAISDGCDVLIFNDFAISYLNRVISKKVIHYIHGKESHLFYSGILKSRILAFDKIFRNNLNKADSIVCVSKFIKSWVQHHKLVDDTDKLVVVENQIDTSLFYRTESVPDEFQLGVSKSKTVLITACRLVEGKGFARMLRIFNDIVREGSVGDLIWFVVGDGDYRSKFVEQISQLGLEEQVILLGRVNRENLIYYYAQSDLFWLLSDYEEAFPLVYKEAIACGLPAVGNDLGGVGEVIDHNVTGLICNRDEEVKELIITKKYQKLNLTGISEEFDECEFANEFLAAATDVHI